MFLSWVRWWTFCGFSGKAKWVSLPVRQLPVCGSDVRSVWCKCWGVRSFEQSKWNQKRVSEKTDMSPWITKNITSTVWVLGPTQKNSVEVNVVWNFPFNFTFNSLICYGVDMYCHNCGGFVFCILPSLCGTDYEKVVFLFLSGTDLATVEASQVQNESTRFVNGGTHLCLFVELLRAVQHWTKLWTS